MWNEDGGLEWGHKTDSISQFRGGAVTNPLCLLISRSWEKTSDKFWKFPWTFYFALTHSDNNPEHGTNREGGPQCWFEYISSSLPWTKQINVNSEENRNVRWSSEEN